MLDKNNMDDVIQAAHQAIELCKEGLSIVRRTEFIKESEMYQNLNKAIYLILLQASSLINDHTNEIEYARKMIKFIRNQAK